MPENEPTLKPCPFCGGTKHWIENTNMAGTVSQWVVTCIKCFKRSKPQTTKNRAIKEWNRRAEDGRE